MKPRISEYFYKYVLFCLEIFVNIKFLVAI